MGTADIDSIGDYKVGRIRNTRRWNGHSNVQIPMSRLRPCVSVTVSGFQLISQKCTDFRENKKPNISVHFSVSATVPTGVPFRKHENVPKIFAKQTNENVRNPCSK